MLRRIALAAAAAAALLLPGTTRAQAPVTIVTAFGAGSAADIVARLLAAEFQPILGVPVVVTNITGAAGTIATNQVVRGRADGNTVLFSPIGPIAIQPNFMRNAGYTAADLIPICMVNRAPLIMMTPQNSGLRTLADVVARARQGNFPYGTTGVGTTPHLSMVMFARAAGVQMEHITYRGPADASPTSPTRPPSGRAASTSRCTSGTACSPRAARPRPRSSASRPPAPAPSRPRRCAWATNASRRRSCT